MKNLIAIVILCMGFLCHASPKPKDTIYTNVEALMKKVGTTKKKTATYYLVLKDGDDKEVKVRIDLKQMDAEIPMYKSSELDIKKLLALKEATMEAPLRKFAEFKVKLEEWKSVNKEVKALEAEIKTIKSGDSLAWDILSIDSMQEIVDEKKLERNNKDKEYNDVFNEYEKMTGGMLGDLKNQYNNRLSSAIEEAYHKLENIETVFLGVQDSPTWHDVWINLIKLDARRPMKVDYVARGAINVTENVSVGKVFYILHYAQIGILFGNQVQPIIDNIKEKEIKLNPYLLNERYALVCDDPERTQAHINSVVNPWDYDLEEKGEDMIALALNEMLTIAEAHIPYEQESNEPPDYKRTAETEEALAKMDCSEFVSRYLKVLGLFDEVPYFHTGVMASKAFKQKHSSKLEFVEGSADPAYKEIQPGDIFLWRDNKRNPPAGHTGVVKSFDSVTGDVEVLEALVWSGGNNDDICKNCTRLSTYKYDSGTLNQHKGWIGYFRPFVD